MTWLIPACGLAGGQLALLSDLNRGAATTPATNGYAGSSAGPALPDPDAALARLARRRISQSGRRTVTAPQSTSQRTTITGAPGCGSPPRSEDLAPSTARPVIRTLIPSGTKMVTVPNLT